MNKKETLNEIDILLNSALHNYRFGYDGKNGINVRDIERAMDLVNDLKAEIEKIEGGK